MFSRLSTTTTKTQTSNPALSIGNPVSSTICQLPGNAVSAGTQVSPNTVAIGTTVSSVTQTPSNPVSIGTTVSSVTQIPSNPASIAGFQSISQQAPNSPDESATETQEQEQEQEEVPIKEEPEPVKEVPLVNNKCCSKWRLSN